MSELSELFARDPLKLTREERTQVITHMRANRAAYMQGQRTTSVEKASKKPAPEKGKLSLGDIEL